MSDASLPKVFTTNTKNVSRSLQGYEDKQIVGIYEYRPNNIYHEGSILIYNKTLYYVKQHFQSTNFEADKGVLIETYPDLLAKDILFEDEFGVLKYKQFDFPQFKQQDVFALELKSEIGAVVGNFNIRHIREGYKFYIDFNYYSYQYLEPITYFDASLVNLSHFLQVFDLNKEYVLTTNEHNYSESFQVSIKFELIENRVKITLLNTSVETPIPVELTIPFVSTLVNRVYRPLERNVILFQDDDYSNYSILKLVKVSGNAKFIGEFQSQKEYNGNIVYKYDNSLIENYFPFTKEIGEGISVGSTVCKAVFLDNSTFQIIKSDSTANETKISLKISPIENFEVPFEEKQLENMQQLGELVSDILDTINSGGGIGGGSDIDTSMVMNKYAEGVIYDEGDIFFNIEDGNPDVSIVAPEARLVEYNNINTQLQNKDGSAVKTVQQAIDRLYELNVPVGSYYIQQALENGTFDENEAPSSLYPNTVWELKYAQDSVNLRTEGSLSEVDRINGIQGDAIRNIVGGYNNHIELRFGHSVTDGAFERGNLGSGIYGSGVDHFWYTRFNASNVVPTAQENRTKNRLIRIYKRIS